MQERMNIHELGSRVLEMKEKKRDYIVSPNRIAMTERGLLGISDREYFMGKIAHEQLATKLNIPKKYYDRMQNVPELLARNVNHWMSKETQPKMVRTLDGTARAILSDRYRPLDNDMILEAMLPTIVNPNHYQVISSELTERRMYIQIITNRMQGEVKTGEVVQQGVTISNSEVGLGSVLVEPFLYILKCLNGAIMSSSLRKYHVGRRTEVDETGYSIYSQETLTADSRAFLLKIKDTMADAFNLVSFSARLKKAQISAGNKIVSDSIQDVVEDVTRKYDMSVGEGESILKNLINGGDLSQWGMSNAVTAIANTIEDYDRAIELQRIGGDIIDLSSKDWNVLAC